MAGHRQLQSPVLVGRDDLLALAGRRLAAAADGRGHLLFVAGEAGIGKTRLLAAIAAEAGRRSFVAVRAAAFPGDTETSGGLLLDLASDLRQSREAGLAEVGEAMAGRLRELAGVGGDRHRQRRLLVQDLSDAFGRLGQAQAVLVVLEDLHWADQLSLEVVAHLATRLATRTMLVAGAYRSDELYPRLPMREWRARLLTQRLAEEVRLPRLSRAETATLTAALLGRAPGAAVADAVHDRSDGIPLHVEELLAAVPEAAAGDGAGPGGIPDVPVPDTLADAVLARAEALGPAARGVANAGAVIGRSFEFELLAAVSELDPADVDNGLRRLQALFLVQPGTDPASFDFRHALIRDVLYGDIPVPERRRLHERVARVAAGGLRRRLRLRPFRPGRPGRARVPPRPDRGPGGGGALGPPGGADAVPAGPGQPDRRAGPGRTRGPARRHRRRGRRRRRQRRRPRGLRAGPPAAGRGRRPARGGRDGGPAGRGDPPARRGPGHPCRAPGAGPGDGPRRRRRRPCRAGGAAQRPGRRLHARPPSRRGDRLRRAEPGRGRRRRRRLTEHRGHPGVGAGLRRPDGGGLGHAGGRRQPGRGPAPGGRGGPELPDDRVQRLGPGRVRPGRGVARRRRRLRRAGRALEPPPLHGRPPGPRPVGGRPLGAGRGDGHPRPGRRAGRDHHPDHRRARPRLPGHGPWRLAAGHRAARRRPPPGRGHGRAPAALPGPVGAGRDGPAPRRPRDGRRPLRPGARGLGAGRRRRLPVPVPAHRGPGPAGRRRAGGGRAVAGRGRRGPGRPLHPRHPGRRRPRPRPGRPGPWRAGRGPSGAGPGRRRVAGAAPLLGRHLGRLDLARCALKGRRVAESATLARDARALAGQAGARTIVAEADRLLATIAGCRPETPWSPLTARELEVARLVAAGNTNREIAAALFLSPKTVSSHVEHILTKLGAARRTEIAAWVAALPADAPPG